MNDNKSQFRVTKNTHKMSRLIKSSHCQTAVKYSHCNEVMSTYSQRKSTTEDISKDTPKIVTDAYKEQQDHTNEEAIRPGRQGQSHNKHLKVKI